MAPININKPTVSVAELEALTGFKAEDIRGAIRRGHVPAIRLTPHSHLRIPSYFVAPLLRQLKQDSNPPAEAKE